MRTFRLLSLLTALGLSPDWVAADDTDAVGRANALIEEPNLPRDIGPDHGTPAPPSLPIAVPPLTDFRLSQTYLPKLGSNGFGIHDTDFSVQAGLPWPPFEKPLLLKGGFGVHAWDGPARDSAGRDPGLPGALYDFYLDLGWKPRPAEWLFLDLGITPGLYTDLQNFSDDAFRLRGRGLAILALSERFQFVGGVLYINRDEKKLIPAGGFIWSPNEDTKLQVVFPQPKLAHRVASFGDRDWWVYAAGEFGGGTWAYDRPDGLPNSVDYNDYRAIVGSELRRPDGWTLRAEVGYVWGRELIPLNGPLVTPGDTVMMRLALIF